MAAISTAVGFEADVGETGDIDSSNACEEAVHSYTLLEREFVPAVQDRLGLRVDLLVEQENFGVERILVRDEGLGRSFGADGVPAVVLLLGFENNVFRGGESQFVDAVAEFWREVHESEDVSDGQRSGRWGFRGSDFTPLGEPLAWLRT